MRGALLICLASALAWTTSASAEVPRTVQLDYERLEGAAGCPDDAAIRTGVAARLGYDPFREKADDRLRATIQQVGRVLEARIELDDAQGDIKARRRLISRNHDCAELASSVELAIAIAIDPLISMGRRGGETSVPSAAAASSAEVPSAAAASPAEVRARAVTSSPVVPAVPVAAPSVPLAASASTKPIATRLDLGLLGGVGFAPAINLGVRVGAALQGDVVSLGLEARADLPAAKSLHPGEVSAALLGASFVPCAHVGMASGCFLVTAGAQRVAGEGLDNPRRVTLPYLGLGVRLGLALPIRAWMDLALHGDMTTPVTETRLKVDDKVVWTSPTIALALGAGLALRFP